MAHLYEKLAKIRDLSAKSRRSGPGSFNAFRDLVSTLLHSTVIKPSAVVTVKETNRNPHEAVIGGAPDFRDAIPLNDGNYLRMTISLYLEREHLKVSKASYQYQHDKEGSDWVFRYDFLRHPAADDPYPPSHFQINANFRSAKRIAKDCPKIHFASGRTSLETFIRMLIVEFNVKSREAKHWEKILAESERLFR